MFSEDYRAVKSAVVNGPEWSDRSYTLILGDRKSVKERFIFHTLEFSGRKRAYHASTSPASLTRFRWQEHQIEGKEGCKR